MLGLYNISPKKSILWLGAVVFLFLAPAAAAKTPNDPKYESQATIWSQINAPTAWDYSVGSRQVIVATIDTGADTWHPDLTKNIWRNPREIPDNGLDDDHNGFADDVNGWNFVENNNDVRTTVFNNQDDKDAVHHGTVVAGLVAAEGDNGLSGTGLNWQVQLMPLRAMNNTGSGSFADVGQAVQYAVDNGAQVISMSFVGEDYTADLRAILRQAYQQGVVIVAAVGNSQQEGKGDLDKRPVYPACFDEDDKENWILGVTSVNSTNRLSNFANYGRCVDLAAPGEAIYSTERYAPAYGYQNDFGGGWRGTSFTAPIVAGAAALIKSIRPDWGAPEIIGNLLATADGVDDFNLSFAGKLGYGRLNLGAAAEQAWSTRPTESLKQYFFYYIGREIFNFDTETGERGRFAKADEGVSIAGLRAADVNGDLKKEVILLVKRDKFYYIRVLKHDGSFSAEFPVGDEAKLKRSEAVISNFEILPDHQSARAVVEQFEPKTQTRRFKSYNLTGRFIQELALKDKIALWRLNEESGNLVLAKLDRGALWVGEIDWGGKSQAGLKLSGVTALDDLAVGDLFGGEGRQAVFAARLRGRVAQYTVDLGSRSFIKDDLGSAKTKEKWKFWVLEQAPDKPASVLRYRAGGGEAQLFKAKIGLIRALKLPKL